MKNVYCDISASTPIDIDVIDLMNDINKTNRKVVGDL